MADIKWIKITTDIFDDDKILLIESLPDADAIIVIWFKLLCLAGKQNNSGVFLMNDRIPYTEKMLATIFRRKESTVQLALQTFEQFGMIEVIDGVITIPNWGKHQKLDSLERKTAYQREYMRDYRNKQKQLAEASSCKTNGKANVSAVDKSREEIREDNNPPVIPPERKTKKTQVSFTPPSREEVRAYAQERNSPVDADRFFDYFDAGGWIDSEGKPVRNWKQKFITWEKQDAQSRGSGARKTVKAPHEYSKGGFLDGE